MAQATKRNVTSADVEDQLATIREDVSKLTKLVVEMGKEKVDESTKAAREGADDILSRAKRSAENAARQAKEKTASIEEHIIERPIQSAIVALLIGIFIGSMSRR